VDWRYPKKYVNGAIEDFAGRILSCSSISIGLSITVAVRVAGIVTVPFIMILLIINYLDILVYILIKFFFYSFLYY